MSAVIELHGVGKRYRKLQEHERMLRSVLPFMRPAAQELWALREFDLTVQAGEILGVLGHNGAGKTTLLRLLAGVTRPSTGRVRVNGRIAPLISLGVGFHPEMSGRENVLVNGMLLGLTARQVARRFDSIVEFAELEEFIDTPIKFYSSGMTMRLGFAVISHVDPAILLVDEILAVGDAAFQLKCFNRLRDFQRSGAAIVMVSHSMHQIRQLCPRAVLVRQGRKVFDGDVERAIAMHYQSISRAGEHAVEGAVVEVVERQLSGGEGEDHHANYNEPMELRVRLRFHRDADVWRLRFSVRSDGGVLVASRLFCLDPSGLPAGGAEVQVSGPTPERIPASSDLLLTVAFRARLGGGSYRLAAIVEDGDGTTLGGCDDVVLFVAGRPAAAGPFDLHARIEVDGINRTDRRTSVLDVSDR